MSKDLRPSKVVGVSKYMECFTKTKGTAFGGFDKGKGDMDDIQDVDDEDFTLAGISGAIKSWDMGTADPQGPQQVRASSPQKETVAIG